jgi:hypothetical protein
VDADMILRSMSDHVTIGTVAVVASFSIFSFALS